MTGEQFLALLERQQMVPPHLIENLRDQVSGSKWNVTAAAVAKLLVDANHLTAFQARQLIGGAGISPKPADDAQEDVELDCATDDFQLTPLDDLSDEEPDSVDNSEVPATSRVPTPPMLPIGLTPLDSPLEDLLAESSSIEASAPLVNLSRPRLISNKVIAALTAGVLTLAVLIYLLLRDSGG